MDEVVCSFLYFIQVVSNQLGGSAKQKLVLDFNQVVTRLGVQSGHLGRQGNKISLDFIDDIADTVFA